MVQIQISQTEKVQLFLGFTHRLFKAEICYFLTGDFLFLSRQLDSSVSVRYCLFLGVV